MTGDYVYLDLQIVGISGGGRSNISHGVISVEGAPGPEKNRREQLCPPLPSLCPEFHEGFFNGPVNSFYLS